MKSVSVLVVATVAWVLVGGETALAQEPSTGPKPFKFTDPKDIPIPTEKKGARIVGLTLDQALRLADEGNADLFSARLGPQRSVYDVIIARAFYDPEIYGEAGYLNSKNPSLTALQTNREVWDARLGWRKRMLAGTLFDVNVSGIRTNQDARSAGGSVFAPPQIYDTSVNLSVTQPLLQNAWWEFGEADILRAQSAQAESENAYEQSRQDTLVDTARAYWELVFARADYRVQFQALELAQEQLRITEARIEVKDLAPRDRVADEAEVARRKEALITAENQIKQREDDLRALLFRERSEEVWDWGLEPVSEMVPDLEIVGSLNWRDAAKVALERRPQLQRLRHNVAIADQMLVLAEGGLMPQLDLVGSYNSGAQRIDNFNSTWGDTVGLDFPDWSLRLLFSYPIGNRAAGARRDRALLDLESARRQVLAEEIRVQREVRSAVRNMKTLAESIRASRESVRLAENDLDTAQHRQRVGALTPFDVQERNQQLQEARSRLQRNHVDFRISEAVLEHAQGKLRAPSGPSETGR